MKKHFRYALLFVAGFGSAVLFQNCSPANLENFDSAVAEKPSVETPDFDSIADSPSDSSTENNSVAPKTLTAPPRAPVSRIPAVRTAEPENLATKLLKNRKWALEKYLEDNQEVDLGKAKHFRFIMSDKSANDNSGRVCAGDCGRAYPISGINACGKFAGYIKVRFIESKGVEALGFDVSNLTEVCASDEIIDGDQAISITDQILQDLQDSSQITLKNQTLTVRSENRTAIFKGVP